MSKRGKKRIFLTFLILLFVNFMIIFFNIKDGLGEGDVMYRFRERQTVTFLSALMLGLTSLTALVIYLLRRRISSFGERIGFWLFSSIGFFYLCMDEYFMAHEGMDEWVGSWFGRDIKEMNLDGVVIAFFGLVALAVCFYFRRTIFQNKVMLPFLTVGGICLAGTVICHLGERIHIFVEVAEESFKIVGVSSFFSAYILAFISSLDKLSGICPKPADA
ncbi:MAG: hypothetical protein GF375_04850 [Candidatus Omnitrophica bacterium]|nr:hypothetical protein [Candidatus Omnitrophota bacterium]MBD3269356.1 hypothetical protein [Candidatus Omnitrophota bacterium]